MAKIAKPVNVKRESVKSIEQAPPSDIISLQLRVPSDIRKEFKLCAAQKDIPMNELFIEVWNNFKKS